MWGEGRGDAASARAAATRHGVDRATPAREMRSSEGRVLESADAFLDDKADRLWRTRSAPYLRPVRVCSNEQSTLFEEVCDCVPVPGFSGFSDAFDRESCGCKGGQSFASTYSFAISYSFPEVTAMLTAFMAPAIITLVDLASSLSLLLQ